MFTSIAGRAVVVTGGARGIGKGIARVFARNGARVLIVGRDERAAQATVDEFRADGGDVSYVLADVSRRSDCELMAATCVERLGGIDVLCANAGIYPRRLLADLTEAEIDAMLGANLKGAIFCVQACLPALERSGRGRIILTSSTTGPITAMIGYSHYGASKAGQLGFMRNAALELASRNITVNAVLPGLILIERIANDAAKKKAWDDLAKSNIPMGRPGTPEEIGFAALFLATEEAAYITGQTIVVDGGLVLPEWAGT